MEPRADHGQKTPNCLKFLDITQGKVKTYGSKVKQLAHASHLGA